MAYESRFISIKPVIESAYRDSGIEEINFETALEDSAELIGLLGVPYTYIDKNTNGTDSPILQVIDYRAYLPDDVAYISSLRKITLDENNRIARSEEMVENPSVFHYDKLAVLPDPSYTYPIADYPIISLDEDEDIVVEEGIVTGQAEPLYQLAPYQYKINNNIIFTSFETGYINLAYKAYPIDDDGYLMIPDDEKLRTALKYNIIYKNDMRKWRANPASPGLKALLNDSEQRRDYYVAAARNKAHIPTIDKMESIKNTLLRSIVKINNHRNGFMSMNKSERRY